MEGFSYVLLSIVCALVRVIVLVVMFLLFAVCHFGAMPFKKIGHIRSSRKV